MASSGILEHYVSSIAFKVQFTLQPFGKLGTINFILGMSQIVQADDCQSKSGLMTASESDGVVVIVLNSDVGLGFSQTLRGKLKQIKLFEKL